MENSHRFFNRHDSVQSSRKGRKGRRKILVLALLSHSPGCGCRIGQRTFFSLRPSRPLREVSSIPNCNSLLSLCLGVLLLAGCQTQTPHTTQVITPTPPVAAKPAAAPEENSVDRRRALLDTDMDFARVSEEKGTAEAFLEFLAPDATLLPDGELPI